MPAAPGSPAALAAQARWRHYGVTGQLHMALECVRGVLRLPTATDEARSAAGEAEQWIELTIQAMATRKDPDSSANT